MAFQDCSGLFCVKTNMNLNISSRMFSFCPKYTILSWKDLGKNVYTKKISFFSGCPVFNMLALRIDFS